MELAYSIQNYAWGKIGNKSKVAELFLSANPLKEIDPNKPYAELWLGTHINGPSTIKASGKLLQTIIDSNTSYLGESAFLEFGPKIPFLLKVLSIENVLSIQAHPNKEWAGVLNAENPKIYKDANHKPEMAITLSPFEAFCGFRPKKEILWFLDNVPELTEVVGKSSKEKYKTDDNLLKIMFGILFNTPKYIIEKQQKAMIKRFKCLDEDSRKQLLADLVEKLYSQYPGDVGCFAPYFLNYIKMEPNQALYLAPCVPHAYISGDCVECMASSDNVVRAGLTPKFIDVQNLIQMLDYTNYKPEELIFKPKREDKYTLNYVPPVTDFAVKKIELPPGETYHVKGLKTASILLVISGEGRFEYGELLDGRAFFIPCEESLNIRSFLNPMIIFMAYINTCDKVLCPPIKEEKCKRTELVSDDYKPKVTKCELAK